MTREEWFESELERLAAKVESISDVIDVLNASIVSNDCVEGLDASAKSGPEQPNPEENDVLRDHYGHVCRSYHAIDDFRAKLLALWPIFGGAAGGVALLATGGLDRHLLIPLAFVGFLASVGMGVYEWTQSYRCLQLKQVARRLEKDMGLTKGQGQFNTMYDGYSVPWPPWPPKKLCRPPQEGKLLRTGVASGIVYGAVILGWGIILGMGFSSLFGSSGVDGSQ